MKTNFDEKEMKDREAKNVAKKLRLEASGPSVRLCGACERGRVHVRGEL